MDGLTLQVYVRHSDKAVDLYKRAFDAELSNIHQNDDGTYTHVEVVFHGFRIVVSESWLSEVKIGNTMQFIMQFGAGTEAAVGKAYETLKDGAEILHPLGPIGWSPFAFGLIDKFGVFWCIAV